jgi:hypothetical protein
MQRKLLEIISVDLEVNSSTADHIFYIRPILEEKWKHNEAVHQLFTDFQKAYDSVRKEVLYDIIIIIELGSSMKIVLQLIKMFLKGNLQQNPRRQNL